MSTKGIDLSMRIVLNASEWLFVAGDSFSVGRLTIRGSSVSYLSLEKLHVEEACKANAC